MRSLATEEAIVASSSPAPPLRGLGAHRDRCVAIFHGMSDDACKGAPAPARPHVCISARGAIGTHANADTCLRSRFAAIAQFTDAAVTTTIVDADAVVSAAAPPLPLLRPCRSDAGSSGLPRTDRTSKAHDFRVVLGLTLGLINIICAWRLPSFRPRPCALRASANQHGTGRGPGCQRWRHKGPLWRSLAANTQLRKYNPRQARVSL